MFFRPKLFLFLFVLVFSIPAYAQNLHTLAKQAYMIDYDTGTVLFEKNANERMPTSSMSKVMTAYVIFDALKNKQISLNDSFLVSEYAWKKGGSKMFIEVGKRVKVEDLLKGLIIQSGNDAAIALAEGLMASEDVFVQAMNAKAKELGMNSTHFKNASGWPDPEHYSTAKDLAILATALLNNHKEYYKYYSQTEFEYSNIKQKNRNPLLYKNMGVDGIKTGHTEVGGYGLIASGQRNGRRVILVINGLSSAKERAKESARLMEWGLAGFKNIKLAKENEEIAKLDVIFGVDNQVPVTVEKDVIVSVPNIQVDNIEMEIKYDRPVIAPVNAGDNIGSLIVKIPTMKNINIPLIASKDVAESGILSKTLSKIKISLFGYK